MEEKLVSVIIPCYNAEKYIEMAVRSIMNQTYKNLEILIIDDCSTDDTFNILKRLANEDSRIKLEKNEKNSKIVKTLNKLIDKANGVYIARMDADDISAPERIQKQVEFLENNPEYGICGTNAWRIDCNNRIIGKSLLPCDSEDINIVNNFFCVFYHPTIMIRAMLYKTNLYREEYLYAEDLELWHRLLKLTKGKNLKESLFYYRILNTSASSASKSGSIQRQLTNSLCNQKDFSELRKIKNYRLIGMIIWTKLRLYKGQKKQIKIYDLFSICLYLIMRIHEKIFYKIKHLTYEKIDSI